MVFSQSSILFYRPDDARNAQNWEKWTKNATIHNGTIRNVQNSDIRQTLLLFNRSYKKLQKNYSRKLCLEWLWSRRELRDENVRLQVAVEWWCSAACCPGQMAFCPRTCRWTILRTLGWLGTRRRMRWEYAPAVTCSIQTLPTRQSTLSAFQRFIF